MIFSILSLIVVGIGTGLLAKTTIVSKKDAIEIGVSRIAGDTDEENLKLPAVKFFLRQSKIAKSGLWIVICGIAIQVITLAIPTLP